MLDDAGSFSGAAAKEIHEETGLSIREDELTDLTALAARAHAQHSSDDDEQGGSHHTPESHLPHALHPSPGGSDEVIAIMLARRTMARSDIDALRGRLTGLREHGEKITLKVVRLEDAWREAFRDGKTMGALGIHEGLRREGLV